MIFKQNLKISKIILIKMKMINKKIIKLYKKYKLIKMIRLIRITIKMLLMHQVFLIILKRNKIDTIIINIKIIIQL